jgi:lipoprotein-anchoring transpeptidase ErfK/SrfK
VHPRTTKEIRRMSATGPRVLALACLAFPVSLLALSPLPAISTQRVLTATTEPVGPDAQGDAVVRVQIRLDRARFSPGEIDGRYGSTLRIALLGFQAAHGLPASGVVDEATWRVLEVDREPTLARYRITAADAAGPYAPVPENMMEKAKLPAMGYASAAEALGERFHASPELLQALNPGKDLARQDEEILVPNVHMAPHKVEGAQQLVVDQSSSTVSLEDGNGVVLAQFPATTGSEHDPLPIGRWKINGIRRNPQFHYNPKLFWDAKSKDRKATIQAGPNNPVGVVWIDLSKGHYGIHGTPEPSKISKTESHGCIRLTNWDANTVAETVSFGFAAVLQQ